MIDLKNVKLGKKDYNYSEKTVKMARFMAEDLVYPHSFDFDAGRAAFPLEMWGNDAWGNCVKVGEANQVIRLERLEQSTTIKITEAIVVEEYKEESKRENGNAPASPGDQYDQGLDMRSNCTNWRKVGMKVGGKVYTISAFGELDSHDTKTLRAAIYHFGGIQFGFALPLAAQKMTDSKVWDYKGEKGEDWQPGSWGGHCVFSKAYDTKQLQVCTWAEHVQVTDAFIERYADEIWVPIDSLDSWRKDVLDIPALEAYLQSIGASNIEKA